MAFTDFQKHCMECKKGEPCGKYHVYVLMLNDDISSCKRFAEANPDYVEGMECLYVGMTKCLPKCRASQHQFCQVNGWEGKEYFCYCSGEGELNACRIGTRGSKITRDYADKYLLRKKLFRRRNPQIDQQSSKEAEESLAEGLRKKGYGVWYN